MRLRRKKVKWEKLHKLQCLKKNHWIPPWPFSRLGSCGVCDHGSHLDIPHLKLLLANPLYVGGFHVIREEAGLYCKTSCGVRLWWQIKEPNGPRNRQRTFQNHALPEVSCRRSNPSILACHRSSPGRARGGGRWESDRPIPTVNQGWPLLRHFLLCLGAVLLVSALELCCCDSCKADHSGKDEANLAERVRRLSAAAIGTLRRGLQAIPFWDRSRPLLER